MALNTTRSLNQLKNECSQLGLQVTNRTAKNGKTVETKEDYILALRNHHLTQRYPNGTPKCLELVLNIESPMLCKRIQELKPEEQERLWTAPSVIAEQKMDGVRALLVYTPEDGFHTYSRNLSVTDYLPTDYADTVHLTINKPDPIKPPYDKPFILDAELISTNPKVSTIAQNHGVVTETMLQAVTALLAMNPTQSIAIQKEEAPLMYVTFDCLMHNGEWIMDKTLRERKKACYELTAKLKEDGLLTDHTPTNISHKKGFFNHLVATGAEGVVLKDLNKPYNPNTSRAHGWVKVKRSASLAQDIDAFITGFIKSDPDKSWQGQIAGISVSVYLEDGTIHEIANVTNIPHELRQEMTTQDENGEPTLKKEYYGKCVTVDGQSISSRARRLRHATLVRWRPDKSPTDCQLTNDFLNALIL